MVSQPKANCCFLPVYIACTENNIACIGNPFLPEAVASVRVDETAGEAAATEILAVLVLPKVTEASA